MTKACTQIAIHVLENPREPTGNSQRNWSSARDRFNAAVRETDPVWKRLRM